MVAPGSVSVSGMNACLLASTRGLPGPGITAIDFRPEHRELGTLSNVPELAVGFNDRKWLDTIAEESADDAPSRLHLFHSYG